MRKFLLLTAAFLAAMLLILNFASCGNGGNNSDENGETEKNQSYKIKLDTSSITIVKGRKHTLKATVTPPEGMSSAVTWTTSNSAIATVSGGVVTGVKAGTAVITVTAAGDKNATASCTVIVTDDDGPPVIGPKPVIEPKDEGYVLVWNDEFNYTGPPASNKWTQQTGGTGWGNNELQYYTNGGNNARADGEKLIITAKRENMGGNQVTSARIHTSGKGDWLYGIIEVRAKVPTGLGTWPAIWMLSTDWSYGDWNVGNGNQSGEIDIMEHVGADINHLVTSAHTGSWSKNSDVLRTGMANNFHVYSIEWLPDKINYYYDTTLQFTYDPKTYTSNPVTFMEWPFDKRFYLLLNLAFGGDWGGYNGVDYNCLPVAFEIDYVRVYQNPLYSK
ncbi:MAG: family 16 glycosylhydrolase [Treponema sp.]|jgi:beta-glucanase (GH16 family)|nr:family 16 glycosylhydrolase [Treponema sp.]